MFSQKSFSNGHRLLDGILCDVLQSQRSEIDAFHKWE